MFHYVSVSISNTQLTNTNIYAGTKMLYYFESKASDNYVDKHGCKMLYAREDCLAHKYIPGNNLPAKVETGAGECLIATIFY
jgi:hypothetical protein